MNLQFIPLQWVQRSADASSLMLVYSRLERCERRKWGFASSRLTHKVCNN